MKLFLILDIFRLYKFLICNNILLNQYFKKIFQYLNFQIPIKTPLESNKEIKQENQLNLTLSKLKNSVLRYSLQEKIQVMSS